MDRMTTRDISRRFTASRTLAFLESFLPRVDASAAALSRPPLPRRPANPPCEEYDRWAGLPDTFITDGHHLRAPKLTFQIRLLRRIC
ncbi:hypothetical protein JB92DRAFT_216923 [Gautieria morchelliformis]|nr:hypothetical protein JB92DRAFT_216923 [Gautieria morchelliformis]